MQAINNLFTKLNFRSSDKVTEVKSDVGTSVDANFVSSEFKGDNQEISKPMTAEMVIMRETVYGKTATFAIFI